MGPRGREAAGRLPTQDRSFETSLHVCKRTFRPASSAACHPLSIRLQHTSLLGRERREDRLKQLVHLGKALTQPPRTVAALQ